MPLPNQGCYLRRPWNLLTSALRLSRDFDRSPLCTMTRTPKSSRRTLRASCSRPSLYLRALLLAASDLIMRPWTAFCVTLMGFIAAYRCRQLPPSLLMDPMSLLFSVRRCGSLSPRPPSLQVGGSQFFSTGRPLTCQWPLTPFWMAGTIRSPPSSVSLKLTTPTSFGPRRKRLLRRLRPTPFVVFSSLRTHLTEGVSPTHGRSFPWM